MVTTNNKRKKVSVSQMVHTETPYTPIDVSCTVGPDGTVLDFVPVEEAKVNRAFIKDLLTDAFKMLYGRSEIARRLKEELNPTVETRVTYTPGRKSSYRDGDDVDAYYVIYLSVESDKTEAELKAEAAEEKKKALAKQQAEARKATTAANRLIALKKEKERLAKEEEKLRRQLDEPELQSNTH